MDRLTTSLFAMREKGAIIWVDNGQLRYRAPRGALSPEQMVMLREMKGEITTILNECPSLLVRPGISVYESTSDIAPLVFQQQFLLSMLRVFKGHDKTADILVPSVCLFALRISGRLNIEALSGSLDALIRRHESLRTRIVIVRGVPMQQIDRPIEFKLDIVDCARGSLVESESDARNLLEDLARKPLDLGVGPIFDAKLVRLAEEEYVLALLWDHTTNDSSSLILLYRELWDFYDDIALRRGLVRPPPPQFADYAVWQRKTYDRWVCDHGEYWRVRLSGADPIRMPVDTQLAKAEECEASVVRFSFSRQLRAALSAVAQDHRTSLGMVLLAVHCATLSRICDQKDFLIPFNVIGRRSPEDLGAIGYFAHALLLRMQLSGRETFPELLKTVSTEFLAAHEHLDYGRNYNEQPLCYGMEFNWYPWSAGVVMEGQPNGKWPDLCIAPFPPAENPQKRFKTSENFRWNVSFENAPEGIRGVMWYRVDLYSLNTIQKYVEDLLSFSRQVVANLPRTSGAASAREEVQ